MVLRIVAILAAVVLATSVNAQSEFTLGPGDRVQIEVLEDPSLNREVLVLPDGSFSFPLAGAVSAGGRTTTQVESALASALAPNFATSPTVSVSVAALGERAVTGGTRTIDIYLMGELAGGGGLIQVQRGTTILQALALSGGFTKFAATKRIQLRRTDPQSGQQTVYAINYNAIEQGASNIGSSQLADGDVIIVPERRLFE